MSRKKPQLVHLCIKVENFIFALGIPNVGEHIARVLAYEFKSLKNLQIASNEQLNNIYEIGPEITNSIRSFFREKNNLLEIEKIGKNGVKAVFLEQNNEKSNVLKGQNFLFTGGLKDFSRNEAKRILEKLGGRIISNISSKVDYVIAGEKPGSKYEKAKKLGLKIIDEENFKKLIKW